MGELPEGVRGRVLALSLLLLVLGALWIGIAAPLLDWFEQRAEAVAQQEALTSRMARIAAGLPALRTAAAATVANAPVAVLAGTSDAVAGAALQSRLQQIGSTVGASLASTEVLAGEPVGRFRRVGVRIAVNARWPVIVRLLASIAADTTRLLVNDLQIQSMRASATDPDPALNVSMVVFGFRGAEAATP